MASKKGMVNIPRDVEDEFYRYKMPILRAKVEGRGNGIKTVIENMSAVAAALERPPTYTTKFFGFELGAQCMCDEKNDKWVVNGKHDQDQLANLLDSFIEKFLLCGTCRNPETSMEIGKNGNIEMRCMACGEVTPVDMRHRLASYIQKNPPSTSKYQKAATQVEQRQAAKASNAGEQDEGMGSADFGDAKTSADDDFGSDNWNEDDFSKQAIEKRRLELLGGDSSAKTVAATTSNGNDPFQELAAFLTQTPPPKDLAILQKVKAMATTHGWKDTMIIPAVFGSLFNKDIVSQIPKRAKILYLFIQSPTDQKMVLYLIERLCAAEPTVAAKISTILNLFYENDILEEETLSKWYKTPAKKLDPELSRNLREKAKKFIEWLETADSDSE